MRRSDRELSDPAALELLTRGEYGIISSVDQDGQPYGVPVSYALLEKQLVFHSAPEGHKLDNIQFNPRVSFCVVGSTEVLPQEFSTRYESVIVTGWAGALVGDEKMKALQALVVKYSPGFEKSGAEYIQADMNKTAVFAISLDHITGKARK